MRRAGLCAKRQALLLSTKTPAPSCLIKRTTPWRSRASTLSYVGLHSSQPCNGVDRIRYMSSSRPLGNQDEKDDTPNSDRLAGFLERLNNFLPSKLVIARRMKKNYGPPAHLRIERFLQLVAQFPEGNLLIWMVKHGHEETAIWMMKHIQKEIAASITYAQKKDELPSNIQWPAELLPRNDVRHLVKPAQLNEHAMFTVTGKNGQALSLSEYTNFKRSLGPRMLTKGAARAEAFLWRTIAELTLASSCTSDSPIYDEPLTVALLAIGNFHELGLMPDDVYKTPKSIYQSHLQRPPILDILSGRIFTALSDAIWRNQSDDAIVAALEQGKTLAEVAREVPGGRFRLKVRPLAPEVWLELTLWTLLDLGYHQDAASVVQDLADLNPNEPWYAARWCTSSANEIVDVNIDWDRVKNRTGGTLGRIEGYSAEKPLVDIPPRTISVEVVLALVDGLVDSTVLQSSEQQNQILKIIRFLEPHNLSPAYFGYLQTKPLVRASLPDSVSRSGGVKEWCDTIDVLLQMETISPKTVVQKDLDLPGIQEHSLLSVGLRQQVMHLLAQASRVHEVLPLFNSLVEYTDKSKYESITNFIETQHITGSLLLEPEKAPPLSKSPLEFGDHGQLPRHILAALLNLFKDTDLLGLGQWMIYAADIDGPLIPRSAYGSAAFCASLFRFAEATKDTNLAASLSSTLRTEKRLPSIRIRRAAIDCWITFHSWRRAYQSLLDLRDAKAGGYGLSNVVHLCLEISRLPRHEIFATSKCTALLESMLLGKFDPRRSDFTETQVRIQAQQTSHIFRVLYANQPKDSDLHRLLVKHSDKFVAGNSPLLPAKVFNILLTYYTETMGWERAKELYTTFCADPGTSLLHEEASSGASMLTTEDIHLPFELSSEIEQSMPDEEANIEILQAVAMGPNDTADHLSNQDTERAQAEMAKREEGLDLETHNPYFQRGDARDDSNMSTEIPALSTDKEAYLDRVLKPMPVTVPDLNTLRILMTAYARARRDGELKQSHTSDSSIHYDYGNEEQSKQNRTRKGWFLRELAKFEIRDREILEQELQEPISELEAAVQHQSLTYHRTRSIKVFKPGEVSELWVPRALTASIRR